MRMSEAQYEPLKLDPRVVAGAIISADVSLAIRSALEERQKNGFDAAKWQESLGLDDDQFWSMISGYRKINITDLAGMFHDLGMEMELTVKPSTSHNPVQTP